MNEDALRVLIGEIKDFPVILGQFAHPGYGHAILRDRATRPVRLLVLSGKQVVRFLVVFLVP